MTIRPIHDFGPAVGEYVPGIATDIRETFDRVRRPQEELRFGEWRAPGFEPYWIEMANREANG
jgi:hypothetical protein